MRDGVYKRLCDGAEVPRFRCRACRLCFSAQTFRGNYRQKRPDVNANLLEHFSSKVTHRQSARLLGVNRKTVLLRVPRFGAICRALHECLAPKRDLEAFLKGGFMLDEAESFATSRRNNPLTIPILIHHDSFFVIHTAVGPLPRRGGKGRDEKAPPPLDTVQQQRRAQGSRKAVEACVQALASLVPIDAQVIVTSDMKPLYGVLLREAFPGRLEHGVTSSKAPRNRVNPLFRINLTLAMARDAVSRLVRRTWAVAKRAQRLAQHMWCWIAYRNYVRGKTNEEWETTPAMQLGVCPIKLTPDDVLRWGAAHVAAYHAGQAS